MNTKGYVLIEMLVAAVILSLAGTGLYQGMIEGLRAEKSIRQISKTYDPLRVFWKRIEKDLRNSVYLQSQPYTGKQHEMVFPVKIGREENGQKFVELKQVRYFVKDGVLKRREQELSNRLVKPEPKERIVFKDFNELKFQYAYLTDEKVLFQSYWLEQPYYGIPKAVRIEVTLGAGRFSKLIPIPQGRWGRMPAEEVHEE